MELAGECPVQRRSKKGEGGWMCELKVVLLA
jgi:hypothetical protein